MLLTQTRVISTIVANKEEDEWKYKCVYFGHVERAWQLSDFGESVR